MGDAVLESTTMVDANIQVRADFAWDLVEILAHQAFDGIVSALLLDVKKGGGAGIQARPYPNILFVMLTVQGPSCTSSGTPTHGQRPSPSEMLREALTLDHDPPNIKTYLGCT